VTVWGIVFGNLRIKSLGVGLRTRDLLSKLAYFRFEAIALNTQTVSFISQTCEVVFTVVVFTT